jgi:membrane protein
MRTWKGVTADHLFGHAAELGFYFLFALFPTLFCAGSILGLAARSASQIYDRLLDYLALVLPTSALGTVLQTFNQTAAAATSGKITFGTIGAVWSASVGVSAIQETLNAVFRLKETRSYFVARLYAIGLTLLLMVIWSLTLTCMLGGDLLAAWSNRHLHPAMVATISADGARILCWLFATALLDVSFAVVYSWAPNWKSRHWHWFTPGTAVGICGWLVSSLGFRFYIHFFNHYTVTYGSLGAVVILLMWFYISGLMLLLGAEIDREVATGMQQKPVPPEDEDPGT